MNNYNMKSSEKQKKHFTPPIERVTACKLPDNLHRPHERNGGGLGIYTKLCATPINRGLQRNAVTGGLGLKPQVLDLDLLCKSNDSIDGAVTRAKLYSLQNHATELLPKSRIGYCLKQRISKNEDVGVYFNTERNKAHYSNLQVCGNIWGCPVCARRISEGRREELKSAISNHNGAVLLLTLTNPHHVGDNLKDLLYKQGKALHYFWTVRKNREMFQRLGKVGHITATEVTHGANGWHPHYHILLFFKTEVDCNQLQAFLAEVWQTACVKKGLKKPSLSHGCDVRNGSFASKYVSKFGIDDNDGLMGKWGLEHEMTKGHIKKGRKNSCTPFDLLKLSALGDERAGRLFVEFFNAFKGKQQLRFTKGLKDLLQINVKSDEQLATETEKTSEKLRDIGFHVWMLIRQAKKRAYFLYLIEQDYFDGGHRANRFIMELVQADIDSMNCFDEMLE